MDRPCGSTHVPVTVRARPYRLARRSRARRDVQSAGPEPSSDPTWWRKKQQLASDCAASALAQTFDIHEISLNPRLNLFGKIAKSLILVYYTIVSLVGTKERSTRTVRVQQVGIVL